jgi:hypothetical protein
MLILNLTLRRTRTRKALVGPSLEEINTEEVMLRGARKTTHNRPFMVPKLGFWSASSVACGVEKENDSIRRLRGKDLGFSASWSKIQNEDSRDGQE